MDRNRRYRVVQWATGNIGLRSLRAVIEHPQLDLVGLYVYSPGKVGRDAGELAGVDPTDRRAWTPTCGTRSRPPAIADSTSLHSTGVSPGFITEAMPFVLTSIQRRLDCLTIDEFADMSSRNSPEMIFDLMGFGRPPEKFDPSLMVQHECASFGGSLRMVADALCMPLDDVVGSGEAAVARTTTGIAAGTVEAGTVAAQRFEVNGMRDGRTLLRFRANWYLTTDTEPSWDLRESGWHVLVEGDTPLDIAIRYSVSKEEYPAMTPGLTADRPVNAIPYVVDAAPGIRTAAELPQIIANLGR